MRAFSLVGLLYFALYFASMPVIAQAPEPTPAAPVPHVQGPSSAHTQDLIILVASAENEADYFTWHVDTSSVNVPEDGGDSDLRRMIAALRKAGVEVNPPADEGAPLYALSDDGKTLYLSSHTGVYRTVLSASNEHGLVSVGHNVTVKSRAAPDPEPDPEPDPPDPDPEPNPDTRFGITKVLKLVVAGIESPSKAQDAQKIARAIRAARTDTSLTDPQDLIDAVIGELQGMPASVKSAWEPFASAYVSMLDALQAAGKLTPDNIKDWRDALAEVEAALRF